MSKVTVGFKCSPEQKKELQKMADEQGMSLSAMMESLNNYQLTEPMENQQPTPEQLMSAMVPTTAPIETTDITITVRAGSAQTLRQEAQEQGMSLPLYVKSIVMNRSRKRDPESRVADALEQVLVCLNRQTDLVERSVANSEAMLAHVVGHTAPQPTAPPKPQPKDAEPEFPTVTDPWKGMSAGNRAFMERLRADHGTQWFDSHLDGLGTIQRECNAGGWLALFHKFEQRGMMEVREIGTVGKRKRVRARFTFLKAN